MNTHTYSRLMNLAPANAFSFAVVDWGSLLKKALAQNKTDTPVGNLLKVRQAMAALENKDANILSSIDWDKLPPPQFFARFLGPSLSFSEMRNGVLKSLFVIYYPDDK